MIDRGWKFHPALKFALPFAAGIVLVRLAAPSPEQLLLLLYAGLCWLALAMRFERIGLAPSLVLIVMISGALAGLAGPGEAGLEGEPLREVELAGRIAGEPVFKKGRIECTVEPDSLLCRNTAGYPSGRVLLRLYDTSAFDPALLPAHGDDITVVGTVQMPAPPANPGEFDYAAYLRSRGVMLVMNVARVSSINVVRRGNLTWGERVILPVRRAARAFCEQYVGGEEGDILRALLLGEREYIDPETREAFTRTGTVHILSVSGFHVGLIALVLFVIVSWIGSRWWQFAIFVALLGLYTVVAGGEAPIVRATVMASAFMLARVAGRISRPLNTLGFAALAILAFAPDQLFDAGFQLSFASVAGIILLYVPAWKWTGAHLPVIRRHPPLRWSAGMILLSLCTQLFTLPLVLYHFGFVSFIALLTNLPVIPLTSAALGAGTAGALAALVSETLGAWCGGCAHAALTATIWMVGEGASIPGAAFEIGTIDAWGSLLLLAAALGMALSRAPRQTICRCAIFLLAVICVTGADRMLDPLRRSGVSYLCLLKGRGGTVAATICKKTVRLYAVGRTADTASLRFIGEALRRRFGALAAETMPLDSFGTYDRGGALLLVGEPLEALPPELPVILSRTARRPLAVVDLFGGKFLQVPLRREIDRAIVLAYDGAWHAVPW